MSEQKVFQFTLVLDGVDDKTNDLEDILFQSACDDALINFRNGTVYLDFDREATNLDSAVISAIKQIEKSELGATVISVAPDNLVSESEIARRLEMKRQTISLWVKGKRRALDPFPNPVMGLDSKSPLWRWYAVVTWLYHQNQIQDEALLD